MNKAFFAAGTACVTVYLLVPLLHELVSEFLALLISSANEAANLSSFLMPYAGQKHIKPELLTKKGILNYHDIVTT